MFKKQNKTKRIIAVILSVMTVFSCISLPAYAASRNINSVGSVASDYQTQGTNPATSNTSGITGYDDTQNKESEYTEYSNDTSANTNVYVTQASEFSVTAPVVLVLNGTAGEVNEGYYSLNVKGNISADEVITVEPEATFSMSSPGKDDISCDVTQEKSTFTYADGLRFDTPLVTSGHIVANGMTAGRWNGSYNYNISLDTVSSSSDNSAIPSGYTVLYEYDLSATESDDVKAYYAVPNENTTPIEVEMGGSQTANANLLSSITNLFKPMTAYAATGDVIEYNGIQYTLSDKDTLVISGTGEMKENIQADLIDYEGIQNDVYAHFSNYGKMIEKKDNTHYVVDNNGSEYYLYFYLNNYYPEMFKVTSWYDDTTANARGMMGDEEIALENEVISYIDSIKENYVVSTPSYVEIKEGVTNISNNAFLLGNLSEISIPNTVTSIGDMAFAGCRNLTSINIPSSVTSIGENAFYYSGLESVVLNEGLKTIGKCAFYDCFITNVIIPNTVETIGESAFEKGMSEAFLKSVVIGNGVKSIGKRAFYGQANITSVYIPDSVTDIGTEAFCDTGLESVRLPIGITEIKSGTFYNTKLTNIDIPDSVITIGIGAFGNTKLTNVVIPNNVKNLSGFRNCTLLTDITFTNSVTNIDDAAFMDCTALSNIAIPENVTRIGKNAFGNCTSLKNIILPNSLTELVEYAFYGSGIEEINIPNNVTSIGKSAFEECSSLRSVYIPNSVTTINQRAFGVDARGIADGSTIYCQSQNIAKLLISGTNYYSGRTTVVVDASKF